jgi:hypothetical protein
VQCIFARGETPDLNLPAFEFSLANTAHPLIIERIPFSESISCTQERQSIVEFDVSDHKARTTLLFAWKQTIGTLDDCVVG